MYTFILVVDECKKYGVKKEWIYVWIESRRIQLNFFCMGTLRNDFFFILTCKIYQTSILILNSLTTLMLTTHFFPFLTIFHVAHAPIINARFFLFLQERYKTFPFHLFFVFRRIFSHFSVRRAHRVDEERSRVLSRVCLLIFAYFSYNFLFKIWRMETSLRGWTWWTCEYVIENMEDGGNFLHENMSSFSLHFYIYGELAWKRNLIMWIFQEFA